MEHDMSSMKRLKKSSHHLNLLKILLAALPTIVFGVFTIVFTIQQNASARATREQDQRQADETNRRVIFKEYIDDMKELLLDENFKENSYKSLLHMRVQTLTALRNLDADRKHDIILFLYENHLIRHDKSPNIELHGADLTDVKFGKSSIEICDLTNISLPGISAQNIQFDGCLLTQARFNNALMSNAKFHSCQLAYVNFVKTNLTNAQFCDNQLYYANFTNALLTRTSIKGGVFQNVDLINTDLYKSDINDQLLYPLTNGGVMPNRFCNMRFPNGSFSKISNRNLVGAVDTQCRTNTNFTWRDLLTDRPINILSKNLSTIHNSCFFMIDKNQTAVHIVEIHTFSLLIDLEQAIFNLSTYLGVQNPNVNDEITMIIHFLRDEGGFDATHSAKKSIKNHSSIGFYSFINEIRPKTKYIVISFVCNPISSNNQKCLFDQVEFSIFKKII
ncbi:hypothetical protein I4U23_011734 [Adineta vaga]|nr:hypothetical protein I4U23_011734 [Adineta vaga]